MPQYHRRGSCRLCESQKMTLVLSLTPTPPANHFVKEKDLKEEQKCYPLDIYFCENCTHVQLVDVVDPVGEVPEIAAACILFWVPVMGKLHHWNTFFQRRS